MKCFMASSQGALSVVSDYDVQTRLVVESLKRVVDPRIVQICQTIRMQVPPLLGLIEGSI